MEKKRERFLEWATQNSSSEAHTFLSLIASNKILLARSNLLSSLLRLRPGEDISRKLHGTRKLLAWKVQGKLKLTAPFTVWNVKWRLLISDRWTLLKEIVFHLRFWTKSIHFHARSAFNRLAEWCNIIEDIKQLTLFKYEMSYLAVKRTEVWQLAWEPADKPSLDLAGLVTLEKYH